MFAQKTRSHTRSIDKKHNSTLNYSMISMLSVVINLLPLLRLLNHPHNFLFIQSQHNFFLYYLT